MLHTLGEYPHRCRAIHVSTSEVFGDRRDLSWAQPDEPFRIESTYAAGKAEQERVAATYCFHVIRITNVWGEGQPLTKAYPRIRDAIVNGGTLTDHTGGAPVQWSWVAEVAQRLVDLLTEPGICPYEHLAPTQAVTFARFVELTAAALGRPVPRIEARTPLAPVLGIQPTLALRGLREVIA
jgi:nucleoside-diphosphate-sugar epimerase